MKKIQLYNRDGAHLWLEKQEESNIWKMKVDEEHNWILQHGRMLGTIEDNKTIKRIDAVDPSGGPLISVGDILDNKYKIVEIINFTTFCISERNND